MPPKGSSHGRSAAQAANARSLAEAKSRLGVSTSGLSPPNANMQELLAMSEAKVSALEERIVGLEAALQRQKDISEELSEALLDEQDHSGMLSKDLAAQKEHSKQLYKALRVERHARQRGQARKSMLEEQMRHFKASCHEMSMNLQNISRNASKAVEALIRAEKENATLKTELSKTLEHCTAEAALAQNKLSQAGNKVKEYQKEAAKLKKKRCDQAAAAQVKAVKRARDQAKRERSVHHLLVKGVYSVQTRNLIRLLVHAGCSRDFVGDVIHAVFRTAGIIVHGNVSRRTVSRVVLEGYFAAQMQLGYEMQQANSEFSTCLHHKICHH